MAIKLKKINKIKAKQLRDQGIPIIFVGNKVNSYHFFGGWGLASEKSKPIEPEAYPGETSFETILNRAQFYLEPELGSRIAFYVRVEYLKPGETGGKGSTRGYMGRKEIHV